MGLVNGILGDWATEFDLFDRFCTPEIAPETDFDVKALADAQITEIPFEGQKLATYTWGTGRRVLLVHGWGSRASHLSAIGRVLVKAGFQVVAFDLPAHGRSLKIGEPNRSTLPEFCRALGIVGRNIEPVYAVLGHSLGAAAAAFVVAGHRVAAGFHLPAERFVLISSPANLTGMIDHFFMNTGVQDGREQIIAGVESYGYPMEAYSVGEALESYVGRLMLVHDQDDEEMPFENVEKLRVTRRPERLLITQGSGHRQIIANRSMLKAVREFLLEA